MSILKELKLKNHNPGAGVPTLNQNHLHGIKLLLPSQNVFYEFDEIIASIFDEAEVFGNQKQR